jgi:aminoglycoside/choline kinase family phosphotransferase
MVDGTARTQLCEKLEFYPREVHFYTEVGLDNQLPPARPYFAAIDETTHDFVLVLEDLGRLRVSDQTVGCAAADAETVIDAIARHQARWWESDRLASLRWLTTYSDPPWPQAVTDNFEAAWPKFVEHMDSDLSLAMRDFGARFQSMVPWFLAELSRPPHTFLHGDLRLDQLFFAVDAADPPVTALDWQVCSRGRGAYDVGYFLSQSLTADTRRSCEDQLLDRYAERLAEHGIDYPRGQLLRDYRLTAAWCFIYPVMGAGRIDIANDRQLELVRTMVTRAAATIEDHDCFSLRPD